MFFVPKSSLKMLSVHTTTTSRCFQKLRSCDGLEWTAGLKAMLHEAIFLATCNATNVELQVAGKNSRVTPHFATEKT